jgi:hypothetical protein
MNQLDFIGGLPQAPFKDIRNTRPSAAEEKAALCLQLGRLCKTPPPEGSERIGPDHARLARSGRQGSSARWQFALFGAAADRAHRHDA